MTDANKVMCDNLTTDISLDYDKIKSKNLQYMTEILPKIQCDITKLCMMSSIVHCIWKDEQASLNIADCIGKSLIKLEFLSAGIDFKSILTSPEKIDQMINDQSTKKIGLAIKKCIDDIGLDKLEADYTQNEFIDKLCERIDPAITSSYYDELCKIFGLTESTSITSTKLELLANWLVPSFFFRSVKYLGTDTITLEKYIRMIGDKMLIFNSVYCKLFSELNLPYDKSLEADIVWKIENDNNPIENHILSIYPIDTLVRDTDGNIAPVNVSFDQVQPYICKLTDMELLVDQCNDIKKSSIVTKWIELADIDFDIYTIIYTRLVVYFTESIILG